MLRLTNKLTFFESAGNPTRFLGVEFECSGYSPKREEKLKEILNKWKCCITGDGSIAQSCILKKTHKCILQENDYNFKENISAEGDEGPPCKCSNKELTFEVKTSPTKGEDFITSINEICGALREAKAKVNPSCGLHVHVDARDLGADDLVKLVVLWSNIEAKMFRLVDKRRQNGGFCDAWHKSLMKQISLKRDSKRAMYDKLFGSDGYEKLVFQERYQSLNFCALDEHGTVENRMHEGTIDSEKVIRWGMLNSAIVQYAQDHTLEEIAKIKTLEALK